MPNRTIYLPEDLDEASRRLDLNLSRLTQKAIKAALAEDPDAAVDARVDMVKKRVAALDLDWPEDYLARSRGEAGER